MKIKVIAIVAVVALLLGAAGLVIGLIGRDATGSGSIPREQTSTTPTEDPTSSDPTDAPTDDPTDAPSEKPELNPKSPALKPALSKPVEDSVYPNVGDDGVDALHYGLDLAWDADERRLTGTATITFRAAMSSPSFQLDLGETLRVRSTTLDGAEVQAEHIGKDLVVEAPVVKDQRYTLEVVYGGSPRAVEAPTTRSDVSSLGWTVTDEGEVWTMQEPYGAYSWYPVNDQPADKAFYDFTITAPAGWVGVANGELTSRVDGEEETITEWHLDSPAASYLVTIAIGDLVMTKDKSKSGVPITYWTPRGDDAVLRRLKFTPRALAWNEERLGAYPYSSLGIVIVDSESGMETQTMITLGNTSYATEPATLVHEITHHWYGDIVTPTDWRDVWMNEGMTMYLQFVFEADQTDMPIEQVLDQIAGSEASSRQVSGPPGAYDPRTFAENNVYLGPALMWHELREKIGDDAFWAMVRKWPTVHADGNATRAQFLNWIEVETGEELTAFFDAWLLGKKTPSRDCDTCVTVPAP